MGIRLFGWYDTEDNIFKNGISSSFWTSTNYKTYMNKVSEILAYGKHFDRTGQLKSGTYNKKNDAISVRLVKDNIKGRLIMETLLAFVSVSIAVFFAGYMFGKLSRDKEIDEKDLTIAQYMGENRELKTKLESLSNKKEIIK